jgi:hypothetical protein
VICVGSAAVTYSDGGYSAEDPQPIFTIVDNMLSQLLGPIRGAIMFGSSKQGMSLHGRDHWAGVVGRGVVRCRLVLALSSGDGGQRVPRRPSAASALKLAHAARNAAALN